MGFHLCKPVRACMVDRPLVGYGVCQYPLAACSLGAEHRAPLFPVQELVGEEERPGFPRREIPVSLSAMHEGCAEGRLKMLARRCIDGRVRLLGQHKSAGSKIPLVFIGRRPRVS